MAPTRKESDMSPVLTDDNVRHATCGDSNRCAFARAIAPVVRELYGARAVETLNVDYEVQNHLNEEDHVLVVWDGDDGRHYDGIITGSVARRIVFLNDLNKTALVNDIRREAPEGIPFTVTRVRSRPKQHEDLAPDTTTLKYAKQRGYHHGRNPNNPYVARANYVDGAQYETFTVEQRREYEMGFHNGLAKGPVDRSTWRKPRRSSLRGRVAIVPGDSEPVSLL